MSASIGFFRAVIYRGSPAPVGFKQGRPSGFIWWSGVCLAGGFAYWGLWYLIAKFFQSTAWVMGSGEEILRALGGGGLMGVMMLATMTLLLLTGFAERGTHLHERDRWIAELEAHLLERDRRIAELEAKVEHS